ncbi:hypothetical protein DIURU_002967 [Diutina rugosa]|uniref:Uncharacterized protein n=1 Tax=Diutina rugosa TaxID=5481 RepID=A0A642UN85_DIURU|nr:uncharacterized protein DIURU_002967 [Diutina rugosa]KAA8902173.1 hypothetical protein DIURU_002967 [Diutina rugosa]
MFSRDSYYKKEQKRIIEEVGDLLLELVLQFLPHLQFHESARLDMWEVVAIKINNSRVSQQVAETRGDIEKVEEIPLLNGLFVTELYEMMMKEWKQKHISLNPHTHQWTRPEDIKASMSTHRDALLFQLYQLTGYGYEVMADLAKERLEASHRLVYSKEFDGGDDHEPTTSAELLAKHRNNQSDVKLESLEKELKKTQQKLALVEAENKRLLELNHELLQQMGGKSHQ